MAPPIREAAAAAEAAARAAAQAAAEEAAARQAQDAIRCALQAVAPAAVELGIVDAAEAAPPEPDAAAHRPSLDAVSRRDEAGVFAEAATGLTADLKATVDPEDYDEPAELAATPRLAAKCAEPDLCDDGPRGHASLDAVLIPLSTLEVAARGGGRRVGRRPFCVQAARRRPVAARLVGLKCSRVSERLPKT